MNFLHQYNILFNELIFVFVLSDRPLMALKKSPWVRRSSCSKNVTLHSKGLMHLYLLWLFFFSKKFPERRLLLELVDILRLTSESSLVELLYSLARCRLELSFGEKTGFPAWAHFKYTGCLLNIVFFLTILWLFWTLLVLLVFYLPGVCT